MTERGFDADHANAQPRDELPAWVQQHSVDCVLCPDLADEREAVQIVSSLPTTAPTRIVEDPVHVGEVTKLAADRGEGYAHEACFETYKQEYQRDVTDRETLYVVHNPEALPSHESPLAILQQIVQTDSYEHYDSRLAIYQDRVAAVDQLAIHSENGDDHLQIAEIDVVDPNVVQASQVSDSVGEDDDPAAA